jgi:hypothetical protein
MDEVLPTDALTCLQCEKSCKGIEFPGKNAYRGALTDPLRPSKQA